MNRTFLTSSTTLVALLVLVYLGGGAIEDFALTMFVGILVGTYSSIYVAAPLTLTMDGIMRNVGWKPMDPAQRAKLKKDPNDIPPVIIRRRPS
jgi:preprotein translocase subunit SecF